MVEIPMTPEQFARAGRELQEKQGVALTGTEGKISKSGVTAGYTYDGSALKVTILEKPFFVSTDFCEEQLRKWLAAHPF